MFARVLANARLFVVTLAFLPAAAGTTTAAAADGGDNRVTSVARLLAGLPPSLPAHFELVQNDEWRNHRDAVSAGWAKVKSGRAVAMNRWRDGAIGDACPVGNTLLYPFSGPDFYNAHVFFPRCRQYLMFGLEHPGEVPDVERMDPQAFARLLRDVRVAVTDLVERNYFITSRMAKQLRTAELRGVVPVIIASMALAGLQVRSVEPLELPATSRPEGELAQGKPMRQLRAVKITFQRPGGELQTLQYFSLDATDRGLSHYPEFVTHLRSLKPASMLIKSASYLLHSREFRNIRDALLDSTEFLVQDDTGMPFDVLRARGWDVQLFGQYLRPIAPFQGAFQPDLDRAFRASAAGELPFSFSYHWRPGNSNAMVGRRVGHRLAEQAPALPAASVPLQR